MAGPLPDSSLCYREGSADCPCCFLPSARDCGRRPKSKADTHVAAGAQLVPAGKATLPTDFHPAMSPTQLVHLCHFIKGCKMQCTNSITPLTFISSNSL